MIGSRMRYVFHADRKPSAGDLRLVYGAANLEDPECRLDLFDQTGGGKYGRSLASAVRERDPIHDPTRRPAPDRLHQTADRTK